MKRLLVGGAVVSLVCGGMASSFAGTADGQGAQKTDVSVSQGGPGDCKPGDGKTRKGFVILNAPGKSGETQKVVGEVSLKDGTPGTTYMVLLAKDGSCSDSISTLTTNAQGNGNAHINSILDVGEGSEYYVVLTSADETLASEPVLLR